MKKLMILAALGTAAYFAACSDDSSSSAGGNGGDESCTVTATDSSVTQVTVYGETTTDVWVVRGDSIVHTQEGPAVDKTNRDPFVYPKGDQTVEQKSPARKQRNSGQKWKRASSNPCLTKLVESPALGSDFLF